MACVERNKHQRKQQNRYAKAGAKLVLNREKMGARALLMFGLPTTGPLQTIQTAFKNYVYSVQCSL